MPLPKREQIIRARMASTRAKYGRKRYRDNRDPDTVKAEGKTGSGDCWCGKPGGHDWEGKAEGKPHPR